MHSKTGERKSSSQRSKKKKRTKKRNNINQSTNQYTLLPEGEKGEKGAESLFNEIMAEDFPNLGKETNTQIDPFGYCIEKRRGAKGGSKLSEDIYWLMDVESMAFGLGCSVEGGQGWQTSHN